MTTLIQHKRVEFTELFYDLVFVYAISKTTGLIHHLEEGVLPPFNFLTFLVCLLVLVNTWMIQTMFTNRFGKNSFFNMVIMFIDMGLLMLLANSFSVNWESVFQPFTFTIAALSFTLFLQYWVQYHQSNDPSEKDMITCFFWILGLRTVGVFISALLPYQIGIWLYFASVIGSFIMPLFFQRRMTQVPINFPHLVERISLLVIISFGEMIVGVANFFTLEGINLDSFLDLFIVVLLFLLYFGEFDHAIDQTLQTLGMRLIYSHYLIFAGILMVTVSLTFLREHDANHLFVVTFLYVGIGLFLLALCLNGAYNQPAYRWSTSYLITVWGGFALGFTLSLLFSASTHTVTLITTGMLLFIWVTFIRFYLKRHRDSHDPHPIHFI